MTTIKVYIQRWLTAYSRIERTEYIYGSGGTGEYVIVEGGYNWNYGWVDLSRSASGVPLVYNFVYKFRRWAKSTLRNLEWQEGVESDNTGWYFNESTNALRQKIFANQLYYPDTEGYNYEYVQAYDNETWHHEFVIVDLSGKSYYMEFNGNGGNGLPIDYILITYYNISKFPLSNTYTRTGFTFDSWDLYKGTQYLNNYAAGAEYTWNGEHAGQTNTAYVKWKANTYKIVFNGNNSTSGSMNTMNVTYGTSVTLTANTFSKSGHIFSGWGLNTGWTGTPYFTNSQTFTYASILDFLLYAIWEPILYTVTYTSILNGITTTTPVTKLQGTIFGTPPNDLLLLNNLIGNIFKGWSYNSNPIQTFTLNSNMILIAIWEIDTSISFSSIQDIFGGNNSISLSEYYLNSGYVFSPGGNGISYVGQIQASQFINKYKSPYMNYLRSIAGNISGNMDETESINIDYGDETDNGFRNIGTVGFKFFWYGIDYGTTGNIQWNANNVLTFGGGSTRNQDWVPSTSAGILMGQSDRRIVSVKQFKPYTIDDLNIKRLIVKANNNNNIAETVPSIQMEIILMRTKNQVYPNKETQYIEIRINKWSATTKGIWALSDTLSFSNILDNFKTNLNDGVSIVLTGRSDGSYWYLQYDNSYIKGLPYSANAITIIDSNLVLHHNSYYVTHENSYNRAPYQKPNYITIWDNLANTNFITKQDNEANKPIYNVNSVVFSEGKAFISNINLHNYSQMNIFIVWKKTAVIDGIVKFIFTMAGGANTYLPRRLYYADNTMYGSYFAVGIGGSDDSFGIFKFPLNSTVIINFEFNSPGNIGTTYINGEYLGYFTNGQLVVDNTIQKLIIGAWDIYGNNAVVSIIYEVIVINRQLTVTERRNIHNQLCSKWNIFDDITRMTINLVLRHDAKNIDGDNNKITFGSTVAVWHNSASPNEKNAQIKSVQSFLSEYPTYTINGVEFTTVAKRLTSNINLHNYPQLNIFVVFKRTSLDSPTFSYIWRSEVSGDSYGRSIFLRNSPNLLYIGTGDTVVVSITNPFTINTTYIVNCEYNNLEEKNGKFYLNNINLITFTCEAVTQGTITTSFCKSMISIYYEIIVIDRLLTTTERTKIYNHLKTKWNVP